MRLPEGLAKEPLRRFGIAFGREQEVDRLAAAVYRPVQVGPAALYLHIRLIHPPRAVAQPQVRPDPLLDLRRVGLDPAVNGRVVHGYAAVGEHQLEVAVADGEHEVPANRPEDHLGGELPPLEGLVWPHLGRSLPSRHGRLLSRLRHIEKLQQNLRCSSRARAPNTSIPNARRRFRMPSTATPSASLLST